MFKIVNKSFMPLQLILNNETVYLSHKASNILYLEELTEQIKNLRMEGILEIKKIK